MLAGILLVLTGLFGGWSVGLFYKDFDYKNIKPEDLGKEIKTDIKVYTFMAEDLKQGRCSYFYLTMPCVKISL